MRKSRSRKNSSEDLAYGVPVPAGLHEAIERERGNLSRAESVLGCLAISMEHDVDPRERPYYPDVAQLAREMVRQSINRLDSLALQERLLKNRVEELCGHGKGDYDAIAAGFAGRPLAVMVCSP